MCLNVEINKNKKINVETSSCTAPVILVGFECKWNFLYRFSKNFQMSNVMKIRPLGTEFFHAFGQADRYDETNSRCSRFYEHA